MDYRPGSLGYALLVPGFRLKRFRSALLAAVILAVANTLVRPLLLFLALPLNLVTFGLFTFVVNATVLRLVAGVLDGFAVRGWGPALLGAVVFAVLNAAFYALVF
jgi:putative membrane protein